MMVTSGIHSGGSGALGAPKFSMTEVEVKLNHEAQSHCGNQQ